LRCPVAPVATRVGQIHSPDEPAAIKLRYVSGKDASVTDVVSKN